MQSSRTQAVKPKVSIVDFGNSNLISVYRGIRHCGGDVAVIDDAKSIAMADRLVIPGVGAFRHSIDGLKNRGLIEPILTFAATKKPLLGICIGMQMLFDRSHEFGDTKGLGLIPGDVRAIPKTTADGAPHKIPHIGWNCLRVSKGRSDWQNSILHGIDPGTSFYFVHSYCAWPQSDNHRLADADYNGRLVSAVVQSDNIIGCQFHPEKSGEPGLHILKNFLSLT